METNRDERLDFRSVGDLRAELKRLAASYTPEWAFSEENPDVGSVVALIFANQMSENIRKMNLVLDKYHTEFVNMLNLSLRPAYPASGVAVLELLEGGVPGVYVPGGTRLIGQGNGEEDRQILFETTSDLYVTSSRLRDVIAASGFFGKLIPWAAAAAASCPARMPRTSRKNPRQSRSFRPCRCLISAGRACSAGC